MQCRNSSLYLNTERRKYLICMHFSEHSIGLSNNFNFDLIANARTRMPSMIERDAFEMQNFELQLLMLLKVVHTDIYIYIGHLCNIALHPKWNSEVKILRQNLVRWTQRGRGRLIDICTLYTNDDGSTHILSGILPSTPTLSGNFFSLSLSWIGWYMLFAQILLAPWNLINSLCVRARESISL